MEIDDFFPGGFTHKIVANEIVSNENFSGKFRVSIKDIEDFKRWLNAFEEKTNTTWILKRSLSSDEHSTYIVNRNYVCQHSSFRKRKKDNGSLQVKDKNCMASFTIKVKKSTRHTRYNDPYVNEGLNGILNMNFKHSHLVNDAEAWTWLRRSEETKKVFIKYFLSGMSPSTAIKHHENILCFEDPELLANSRRNPPKAWVYALHESWSKDNEDEVMSDCEKNHKQRKISEQETEKSNLKTNASIDNPDYKDDQRIQHQGSHPHAPCIIHMNYKLNNDADDLKYLIIPDVVKDLFFKYFDDGLNVSEAVQLNEENIKRDKSLPQFKPSLRLVNFIYRTWSQQSKRFNNTYILSVDKLASPDPCIIKDEDSNMQIAVKNVKHIPVSSPQIFTESSVDGFVVPQTEANNSLETDKTFVPNLSCISTSETSAEKLFVSDKNISLTSNDITVGAGNILYINNKPLKISIPPKVHLFQPTQDQDFDISSSYGEDPVITVSNSNTTTPTDSVLIHTQGFPVPDLSLEKNVSSTANSLTSSDKENISESFTTSNTLKDFSGFLNESSNPIPSELSIFPCQTTFSDSFNYASSNHFEPHDQSLSSFLQCNILYDSSSCSELNSQSKVNEVHDFDICADNTLESVSKVDTEIKEMFNIYVPSSEKSVTSCVMQSSPSDIDLSHKMKEISPNICGVDALIEPEDSNFGPPVRDIFSIDAEECSSKNGTPFFYDLGINKKNIETNVSTTEDTSHITPLSSTKENGDHQFLMSLLPELECIPDIFKTNLKNEIRNLILSSKLAAAGNNME